MNLQIIPKFIFLEATLRCGYNIPLAPIANAVRPTIDELGLNTIQGGVVYYTDYVGIHYDILTLHILPNLDIGYLTILAYIVKQRAFLNAILDTLNRKNIHIDFNVPLEDAFNLDNFRR